MPIRWESRVRAERPMWQDGTYLYFYEKQDGRIYRHEFIVTRLEVPQETLTLETPIPSLSLTDGVAQELMEELWRIGYRPKDGQSSMAHTEAMKYHLEDMRKLVFKNG